MYTVCLFSSYGVSTGEDARPTYVDIQFVELEPEEEIPHDDDTCYVVSRDCSTASDRFR